MIKKTYDIAIKIGRDDIITAPAIVVQNDYDVYKLNIRVFDGNTEIDYSQVASATITFALANDAVVQSDPDRLTLSPTGISYDMGTDEISCPGQVIASVQLFGTDNERLTTARFKFTVQQDLITPGAVQSDSKFPLLQQLMTEVQQLKQDIVELQIPDNSIMDTKLSDAAGQIKARLAELLDDFTSLSGQFDAHVAENASLTQKGHIQLSNDINNSSSTLGASANAVKALGDYFKSFGLGIEAVEKMNTDLNDVVKTGFYKGVNMANSPNPSNYYYILCVEWNTLGCIQLAFRNSGTFYHEIFIRQKATNTWYPWIALVTEYDIRKGTGNPEGVVTAPVGAIYRRTDTGNGELYVKKTGTGNTGWGKVTVE